jgi:hypothetical protein
MPWWERRATGSEQCEAAVFDDGGTGLFEACTSRFAESGWTITCDRHHAVWVKAESGSYSIGLAPWVVGRYSTDTILDYVERKMRNPEARLGCAGDLTRSCAVPQSRRPVRAVRRDTYRW